MASRMYKTITTKKPLLPLHELFPDIFLHLLYYIQAPSIIISRINKTKTIAADEPHVPQLPIYIPPFLIRIKAREFPLRPLPSVVSLN